ncbi:MAG TPA: hypothetical protein PKX10_08810, partial [Propioniciclava tarda]|nr:hypothetical protein [Propioniciclava tarda]
DEDLPMTPVVNTHVHVAPHFSAFTTPSDYETGQAVPVTAVTTCSAEPCGVRPSTLRPFGKLRAS